MAQLVAVPLRPWRLGVQELMGAGACVSATTVEALVERAEQEYWQRLAHLDELNADAKLGERAKPGGVAGPGVGVDVGVRACACVRVGASAR
jgi:hypothetical protein